MFHHQNPRFFPLVWILCLLSEHFVWILCPVYPTSGSRRRRSGDWNPYGERVKSKRIRLFTPTVTHGTDDVSNNKENWIYRSHFYTKIYISLNMFITQHHHWKNDYKCSWNHKSVKSVKHKDHFSIVLWSESIRTEPPRVVGCPFCSIPLFIDICSPVRSILPSLT